MLLSQLFLSVHGATSHSPSRILTANALRAGIPSAAVMQHSGLIPEKLWADQRAGHPPTALSETCPP